jgi:hypothetical protein
LSVSCVFRRSPGQNGFVFPAAFSVSRLSLSRPARLSDYVVAVVFCADGFALNFGASDAALTSSSSTGMEFTAYTRP